MFDETDEAFAVVSDLEAKGIPPHHITVDTTVEADKAVALRKLSFFQRLGDAVTGRDRRILHEGVRRGSAVVTARVEEPLLDSAVVVMKQHGAVDIDERTAQWKEEGFQTQDTDHGAAARLREQRFEQRAVQGGQEGSTIPVVEEQLRVGKREVQHGGVRVYSHVVEQPVEQQVQLREEHIQVERRPVDRPVAGDEPGLFQEGSFEVIERAEEVVVGKEAHIVEEVIVGKEVSERTETVRDTLRHTDVQVEQIPDSAKRVVQQDVKLRGGQPGYQQLDDDFRKHYQRTFASGGAPYDQYAAAYRYPWQFDQLDTYRDRPWNEVEPYMQRSWESRNPGTWTKFKDAIHYGWDRLTGKASGPRSKM
jgi:uncharacterized protein (TIGR02271 family)